MKTKFNTSLIYIVLTMLSVLLSCSMEGNKPVNIEQEKPNTIKGTAIIITGAASRIPQEAALLEQLDKSGWLKDVTFVSGASSGALNTVMLNAILSGKFTWDRYRKILYSLSNDQIYIKHKRKIPFDTSPLHDMLYKIIHDSLGYAAVGDLPLPSAISTIGIKVKSAELRTMRFSNEPINTESKPQFDLVDLLMASTAIPIVFPPIKIKNDTVFPDLTFIDGGAADDRIPYEALFQYISYSGAEPEKIVIVSKKYDSDEGIKQELQALGLKQNKLTERLGLYMHQYTEKAFISRLKEYQKLHPGLAERTYIFVPEFEKDFALLNFNEMKEQYELSSEWASRNQPILLSAYIAKHEELKTKADENLQQP